MEKLEIQTELENSPETGRESFFRTIRSKLMSLALAGFITFGPGALQESYAEQLRMVKKDKAVPEFVLENGITQEKMAVFRKTLEKKDPEFIRWVENYKKGVILELDKMIESILKIDQERDANEERLLAAHVDSINANTETGEALYSALAMAENDHKIMAVITKQSSLIREYTEFIKDNLDEIILGVALLDDSSEVRTSLMKNARPPNLHFHYHNFYRHYENGLGILGLTEQPIVKINKADPKSPSIMESTIRFTPDTFGSPTKGLNVNQYVNLFVHELTHALKAGSFNSRNLKAELTQSALRSTLLEGSAQNTNYELGGHLNHKNKNISPQAGESEYDQRLILVNLVQAILKAGGQNEAFAKWDAYLIGDQELLNKFRSALVNLKLDPKIADDLSLAGRNPDVSAPAYDSLVSILTRLKMNDVQISPEFLREIITRGRNLPDWQISNVESIIKTKDLPREIAWKEKQIKKQ